MATKTIRMKAKIEGGETLVRALMTHPMETGLRKNSKGEKIPAHFISEVTCEHAGKTVLQAQWGPAISQNPYLAFRFKGAQAGDTIKLSWVDNKGDGDSAEAVIK